MRFVRLLLYTAWLTASHVQAAAVFAHFIVGNVPTWGLPDWKHDIRLATKAHIDALALNMAYGWYANEDTLALAFQAAEQENFQFLIKRYSSSSAYFQHKGGPFVSTFEGPGNAGDWNNIKAQRGCFFVPDWSSLGAIPAADAADGVVDGLFNWASWPWGNKNMTTFIDASYLQTLNETGKPYMMPVSPWFYTNMPGYDKNWLWRDDDTWYQRWQQIWYLQPEFVQIIS
ncbi:glycoside hydrolase [Aspergillus pseudocaelatus]|uniref:Glycoside hydrolase n=1 Tax=Aspergillus pseudocaelatus TaxID=1825620 RepID=A0ABQ6WBS0_9EURO|nr:glycoside hydrolase [Aspergillus pseudocaelatus]